MSNNIPKVKPLDPSNLSPIAKARWTEVSKRISTLNKAVNNARPLRTITETFFISRFLPYFAGEEKPENMAEMRSLWLQVAGDVYGEVEILDKENKVVQVVPPLGNRATLKMLDKTADNDFALLATKAVAKGSLSTDLGDHILLEGLNKTVATRKELSSTNAELTTRWEALLKHYGKGFKNGQSSIGGASNGSHNVTDDDFA